MHANLEQRQAGISKITSQKSKFKPETIKLKVKKQSHMFKNSGLKSKRRKNKLSKLKKS